MTTPESQLQTILKTLREELHLTQKQWADALEVSTVYVSYLENGTRTPSKKLLKKAFSLSGQAELPPKVQQYLKQLKQPEKHQTERSNTIYHLQAQGLYSLAKLQRLIKAEPGRLIYVLGLYHLYHERKRYQEADQVVLSAIPHMQTERDRKWLEAYHFQLQGTQSAYERALSIMQEALELAQSESRQNPEAYAEMLFRQALIYYDYGVWCFNQEDLNIYLPQARQQFEAALRCHQQVQTICFYPYASLDHANLYFWLAMVCQYQNHLEASKTLLYELKQHLENFISSSQKALIHHFRETVQNSNGFFTKEYLITNHTYVALAWALLAHQHPINADDYFRQGEWLLSQHVPFQTQDDETLYRAYYNMAHFYDLKCLFLARKEPKENSSLFLKLCLQHLDAAKKMDPESLSQDLKLPLEMQYLKKYYPVVFDSYVGGN